jgi:hypothetical protein
MRINQSINPMFSCFCVVFGLGRADRFGERERDLCSYVFFFLYRGVVEIGCCFVRIEKSDGPDGFPFRMVLPLWRHPGSANLMVDKDDRKAMLLRLFNEKNPQIKNHVADKARAEQEAKENGGVEAEEAERELIEAKEEEEGGDVDVEDAPAAAVEEKRRGEGMGGITRLQRERNIDRGRITK